VVGPNLGHGLGSALSGSEVLKERLPGCRVVKAYPTLSVKPAMFFCGNDPAAKTTVGQLIRELGWQPLDVGGLEQALHLEHMTLLWVRMVRVNGHSPPTWCGPCDSVEGWRKIRWPLASEHWAPWPRDGGGPWAARLCWRRWARWWE
jgi:hypothetical protein